MGIEPGRVLASRYRADVLLGRGGMGEVWKCFDLEEKRDVAIKTLLARHLAEPWLKRLFHAEVVAVAQLSHPGIVEIYDLLDDADGTSLLVMGYQKGASLDTARPLTPTWTFVRTVLKQMLEALAHAHARSVLHLDIKPPNVLLGRDSSNRYELTIVDFGVSRVKARGRAAERWVDRDAVFGTPEFMAPEQFTGELAQLGTWTDIYAVGMLAYDLCAGDLPLSDLDPMDSMAWRASKPLPPLVPRRMTVPAGFCELVARMLDGSPSQRPSCAADVLTELDVIDGADGPARRQIVKADSVPPIPPPPTPDTPSLVLQRKRAVRQQFIETVAADTVIRPTVCDANKPAAPATREVPAPSPSQRGRAGDAERAFMNTTQPTPGAYGLFGLRQLPVLGRVEERRRLWTSVGATAIEGHPRAVLFSGPAGTGKSRLARDATERAIEFGLCQVVTTHWSASGSPDEGLRGLVENALESRGSEGDDFEARVDFWLERHHKEADAFAREAKVLLRPERDAAPDAELPVRVAVDVVSIAASQRPVVLWLDDVQWSRGEATKLVLALARIKPLVAVCVLATARDDELGDGVEHAKLVKALEALAGDDGVSRIDMQPLDVEATRTLVRGLLDLEDDLADVVVRRSEGNPLFVTQLVGQLVGERAIEAKGAKYVLSRAVDVESVLPSDLEAVWARRVAVSGAELGDLQALAVVRERIASLVVAELVRVSGEGLAHSIDLAMTAGLVRKEGELYTFSHGLLRQYLTRTVSAEAYPALAALSAQALEPLVGREDVQAERANHLRRAKNLEGARTAMLEASLWSWRRLDHDNRRERLATLLEWAIADGATGAEARALAESASLFAEQGKFAEANEAGGRAVAAVARLKDPATADAAWVWVRDAQRLRLQGKGADAKPATARALEVARMCGEKEVETIALGQAALDAQRSGDFGEAARLFDCTLLSAKTTGNRAIEAQAAAMRAQIEEAGRSEASLAHAIEMARAAGALRIEIMARSMWCDALWRVGERERARREVCGVSAEADRRRLRQIASLSELQAACWAVEEDDWAAARTHRDAAAAHGAATGAVSERAHLSGLDLALALADSDSDAVATATLQLLREGKGYGEKSFRELLRKLESLSPADLRNQLRALSTN